MIQAGSHPSGRLPDIFQALGPPEKKSAQPAKTVKPLVRRTPRPDPITSAAGGRVGALADRISISPARTNMEPTMATSQRGA